MQQSSVWRRRSLSALGAFCALTGCIIGNGDKPTTSEIKRAPLVHRTTAPVCGAVATSFPEPDVDGVTSLGCVSNEECTSGTGHCVVSGTSSQCEYDTCSSDFDCPGGVVVCECAATGNSCVANGCHDDADCGKGGYCSPTQSATCGKRNLFTSGTAQNGYPHYCHTQSDQCLDDTDCAADDYCYYQASSRTWRCGTMACD